MSDLHYTIWNVKADIVKLFFERLSDRCHNSTFKMEECLMEYALSGKLTHGLKPKPNEDIEECDICFLLSDIEEKNSQLELTIDNLKNKLKKSKDQFKKLKQESVLFSMDDLN